MVARAEMLARGSSHLPCIACISRGLHTGASALNWSTPTCEAMECGIIECRRRTQSHDAADRRLPAFVFTSTSQVPTERQVDSKIFASRSSGTERTHPAVTAVQKMPLTSCVILRDVRYIASHLKYHTPPLRLTPRKLEKKSECLRLSLPLIPEVRDVFVWAVF